jgi:hypothetical protein
MNFMKRQIIKINGKLLVRYIPKNSFLMNSIIQLPGSTKQLSYYINGEKVSVKINMDKPGQISICPLLCPVLDLKMLVYQPHFIFPNKRNHPIKFTNYLKLAYSNRIYPTLAQVEMLKPLIPGNSFSLRLLISTELTGKR